VTKEQFDSGVCRINGVVNNSTVKWNKLPVVIVFQ